jgi:phosphatidylglycerophosphate synthase
MAGAMLTLPNILTLSRIVTVPVLAALLWFPRWPLGYGIGFAVYCLMGITDYFDGYLARAQGRFRSSASSSIPSPTRSWWRRSSSC